MVASHPSYPPADALLAWLASVDWQRRFWAGFTACCYVVAFFHALGGLARRTWDRRRAPAPAAPDHAERLATFTVPVLRAAARHKLGSSVLVGGRRIAQARKSDLIAALQGVAL